MIDFEVVDGMVSAFVNAGGLHSSTEEMARLAAAVTEINRSIEEGRTEGPSAGVIEKLEKWLKEIVERLQAIVERFPEVQTFSVSVGVGLAITLTFGRSAPNGH